MRSIEVKHLNKKFNANKPTGIINLLKNNFYKKLSKRNALNDISFSIEKGEIIGIIGANGSGKTTLLRTIAGIYQPNTGEIKINGSMAPLLQIGTGFHEELIAHENIMVFGLLLGLTKNEIEKKVDKIIKFAELDEFRNMKLKHYSTGMKTRLAFSTAMEINSDILLIDEILSVGDIAFKKKSFKAFLEFKEKGKTILYASHSIGVLPQICDKVIVLNKGQIVMIGEPMEAINTYKKIMGENNS